LTGGYEHFVMRQCIGRAVIYFALKRFIEPISIHNNYFVYLQFDFINENILYF